MNCKVHPKYKALRAPTSTHPECTCAALFKLRQHPLTAARRIDRTNNAQRLAAARRIEYLEGKIARLEQETRNWSAAYNEQKVELTCEIFKAKKRVAQAEQLISEVVRSGKITWQFDEQQADPINKFWHRFASDWLTSKV